MDLITEIAARFAEEKGIFRLLVGFDHSLSAFVQLSIIFIIRGIYNKNLPAHGVDINRSLTVLLHSFEPTFLAEASCRSVSKNSTRCLVV